MTQVEAYATKRLPFVVHVLALGTFLMIMTEFVVAGLLPQIADDLRVSVARAGLSITVFAAGMIVGAPLMAMATLRLPRRRTLILALAVFAAGHVIVALGSSFPLLLAARFLTALATGAFWAVSNVVATRAAGPAASSRALGLIGAGGMLATVVGVPLGAFAGQLIGWRGPFWALAALSAAAIGLIARHVPHDDPAGRVVSIRRELSALRSGRLWLTLAACATTTGGVLSAYSYIAPLLTDRAGIAAGLVPLVLAGFGAGALAGSLVAGRIGDARPHPTTIAARRHGHGPAAGALSVVPLRRPGGGPGHAARVLRARRQPGADRPGRPLRGPGAHPGVRAQRLGVQLRHRRRLLGGRPGPGLRPRRHRARGGRRRHRGLHP